MARDQLLHNIIITHSQFTNFTIEFSEIKIIKYMLRLNPHKSIGPDNIHPHILNEVPAFAKPLLILFKESFKFGILPKAWTEANICAIFKKGKRTDPNNYRPISLTSHVVKLFKRIVMDRMVSFCEQHSIIFASQHGFQTGSSCLTLSVAQGS